MRTSVLRLKPLSWLLLATLSGSAIAADYSPNVSANASMKLLWGDTHLHTNWSATCRSSE